MHCSSKPHISLPGAVVAVEAHVKPKDGRGQMEPVPNDEEFEMEELEAGVGSSPWDALWQEVSDRQDESEEPNKRLEEKVREVRKLVGWLEAEIERLEKPKQGRPTTRQRFRAKLLRRKFGKSKLTMRVLRQLREKQKGILRVKTMQLREKRKRDRRRRETERVAREGPRALAGDRSRRQTVSQRQANEIGEFWEGIWGSKGSYQPNHPAIVNWRETVSQECAEAVTGGEPEPLDRNDAWERAIRRQPSWKAPGPDMICAYWYKVFRGPVTILRDEIWGAIDGGRGIPKWLIEGRTVMIEKEGCTGKPEEYRPITCLNIAYKLLTGALTAVLMEHVERRNLLPEEQKALRKGRRGKMVYSRHKSGNECMTRRVSRCAPH